MRLSERAALELMSASDLFAIANRIGSITQHSASELTSDSLEEWCCATTTVQSTAATAGPVTWPIPKLATGFP